MKARLAFAAFVVLASASLSAHVMVSPLDARIGATQKYEVRVHNEGKLAATGIDLEIPADITVIDVAQPAKGSFTTAKSGDRITTISWKVDVPTNKYLALPFTAKNPDAAKDLQWTITEHLADGSLVEWSSRPGAQQKGSVTKVK